MTDTLFSSLFLAVLVATAAFKLWLGYRHQKHVAQHRSEVPREFAQQISLGAHHKAADYTLARLGIGRIDLLINAAWVLILTLGGGLQWLHTTWAGVFTEGSLLHGTAFLASIGVLQSIRRNQRQLGFMPD